MLEIFKITECTLTYSPIPSSPPQYAPGTTYLKAASFKYKINKNLRSPPKFCNAGKRKGQILQTRLRMVYSSQNSDLYRKSLNLTPSVVVVSLGIVTISLFLACPLYSLDRLRYLPANLDNLTSNALLFAREIQTDELNESLFLKVQVP